MHAVAELNLLYIYSLLGYTVMKSLLIAAGSASLNSVTITFVWTHYAELLEISELDRIMIANTRIYQ